MIGLLGRKVGMTQIFNEDGNLLPVTVLAIGPCRVVQKKTRDRDGYEAIQIGFGEARHANRAQQGHCRAASGPAPLVLREMRVEDSSAYELGQELKVDIFADTVLVDVKGTTKGKGFQGVMKRHGFSGGPKAHGSMFHRRPGSIGQSSYPSKVFKGMKMPGRMGHDRYTAQCLTVVKVDVEKGLLLVKGAVPGSARALVEVYESKKQKKKRSK